MKRILGIDYGLVRVGTAVSDTLGLLAHRLETIPRENDDGPVIARLLEIIREQAIDTIVLGMPKRTDGKSSDMEKKVKAFSRLLQEKSGLRPIFRDERYSSVLANRILTETKVKRDKRRDEVDQIAAEIILQSYLDEQR